MRAKIIRGRRCALSLVAAAWLVASCTALPPPAAENITNYMLDAKPAIAAEPARHDLVLMVGVVRALPGFDTPQIAYVRQAHQLDYFVTARWAETPARMLGPLIAQTLERAGGFRAVLQPPIVAPADLRLDVELLHLQHDFTASPSRVELSLRLQMSDLRTQRVTAVKVIEESEAAASADPYGGVQAANRALSRALTEAVAFCAAAGGGS